MENAWIEWFLSTNKKFAPDGKKYRELKIDNDKIRFDDVFEDLHISVYKDILNGGGFGIDDAKPAIDLIYDMKRKY
jgi:UDP-N-acetyl-2-amino-2-deoxyglucuronate dehydrogenase